MESVLLIAVLGMLVYFMIRNNRKQRKTQEELTEKLKPGANVMTTFGLFATVVEIDDDTNIAKVDAGNGVILSLHRQTLTRVVDEEADAEPENEVDEAAAEPTERPAKDNS
jgi:preprotein translocase subunit YajC